MKITNFKKKGIITSIALIILGTFIILVGFGMIGFDVNKLAENGSHQWYRTIYVDDGNLCFGIIVNQ